MLCTVYKDMQLFFHYHTSRDNKIEKKLNNKTKITINLRRAKYLDP
jgi:hypothetical protein